MANQLELTNYGFPVEVIKSRRRTISVEVTTDLRVIVRAPLRLSRSDIGYFINEKHKWIETHLEAMKKRVEDAGQQHLPDRFTAAELAQLRSRAQQLVSERVQYYAPVIGVTYNRITVRAQTSRWGSCSAKGNLNFNLLLALVPEEVADYVVIHELCHRKELNHSERFWAEVERVDPDYKAHRKWLREHGAGLIAKIK